MPTIRKPSGESSQDGHGEVDTEAEGDSIHAYEHVASNEHHFVALPISNSPPQVAVDQDGGTQKLTLGDISTCSSYSILYRMLHVPVY